MPVYHQPQPPPVPVQLPPPLDLVEPSKPINVNEQNNQFLQRIESDYLNWVCAE